MNSTDYLKEAPPIIRDYLNYHETIKGHSKLTVNEYYTDLRTFFRYMKLKRGLAPKAEELEDISIEDVDIDLISSVTLADVYDFLGYLSRERVRRHNAPEAGVGLSAASRSRKIASIRSFYKYLTIKVHLMEENPMIGLDSPKLKQTLPRYLTVEESMQLLDAVDGKNKERDYCILTLFLNCGLRISELVGLDLASFHDGIVTVHGKGNKERNIFLTDSCVEAINDWLAVRSTLPITDRDARAALFVTRQNSRISTNMVHRIVKKTLLAAGLDASKYSAHKLRHTAATLMHQNGVDVRTLQAVLGHEHLNTTEIYTHVDNNDLRFAARANPLGKVKKTEKPSEEEEMVD